MLGLKISNFPGLEFGGCLSEAAHRSQNLSGKDTAS